jgi:hypothetical protein
VDFVFHTLRMVLRGPGTFTLADLEGSIRFELHLEEQETAGVVGLTVSQDAPLAQHRDREMTLWLEQHRYKKLREQVLLVLFWLRKHGKASAHVDEIRDGFYRGGLRGGGRGIGGSLVYLVKRGECRRVDVGTYQLTNRAEREVKRMRNAAAARMATTDAA